MTTPPEPAPPRGRGHPVLVWAVLTALFASIYVVADAERMGFDGAPLVVVQLALTLAVSVVSFYALERPIRHANRLPHPLTFGGGALATASVAVVALVIVPSSGSYWEVDDVNAKFEELLAAGAEEHEAVKDVGGGTLIASVKDADGNVIGLIQPS